MPDKSFSESYKVKRAIELGIIYLNTLSPDPETGMVPYEKDCSNLSPELNSFIMANKEKSGTKKIYSIDKELYKAYKFQKIINDYLLNKNTKEGKRARLLEKNIDMLSLVIPRTPYPKFQENQNKKTIAEKLHPMEAIWLIAMIESLREKDFTKTVNGIKLVVRNSVDGFDLNPLPLQLFCYSNDPIKVSINMCNIHFGKQETSVEFENEFRKNLFHYILNAPIDPQIIAQLLAQNFSGREGSVKNKEGKVKKRQKTPASNILQLRVSLKGINPPIWRKLLVNSDTTLHELHLMIQAAFGWYNYRLYQFSDRDDDYSKPGDWDELDAKIIDSTQVTLGDLNISEGGKLNYLYDFGDY